MKIEYIYHSGFSVETDDYFLVFDYYKGNINLSNKKNIIFSSHGHDDHFNPEIFQWSKRQPDISYILSSDIKAKSSLNTYIMNPYELLNIHGITIKSFGSTDLGLSFLVKVDSKTIFFAGDLNWWHWDDDSEDEKLLMEKSFKDEISKIKGESIDIAFFPVDPRLKDSFYIGGEYFIKELNPKVFIPMHFGDNFETTTYFKQKVSYSSSQVIEIYKRNQIIEFTEKTN
ncbi:putative metal dependent hydrolase [Proteiniborus sp. DW1]|uniref:MBL fold metallo-hydrolase n=1 Tax=Proteiniborus sp. DW1 TaxID=1889883 RepID=UPI00092E0EA8|nr:MBL fold metallo-hydrolase [Proteiniborus sp. DW1]SCG83035.1 putative metal dependent hydrolase [Proteiniborus sp. DW1]